MPKRYGKCTNFGGCPIADSHKVVEINEGDDFVCPLPPDGCGLPLHPSDTDGNSAEFGKRNNKKILIFVVIIIVILGFVAFFVVNNIRNNALSKLATTIVSNIPVKTDTVIAKPSKSAINPASGSQHVVDTYRTPPPPPMPPSTITINNLEEYFNKLSGNNVSITEKINIRKGIVRLFTSPQSSVIPVNSNEATPNGMDIITYVESISITHRTIKVVDKKIQNGKIFEIYVSEK